MTRPNWARGQVGSGAEPLAPACAAGGDHLAAACGRHAGAKTVTALAHQLARLIGPLHRSFSAGRQSRWPRRPAPECWTRRAKSGGLYGSPPLFVNATQHATSSPPGSIRPARTGVHPQWGSRGSAISGLHRYGRHEGVKSARGEAQNPVKHAFLGRHSAKIALDATGERRPIRS
jgi:hypothetical protein